MARSYLVRNSRKISACGMVCPPWTFLQPMMDAGRTSQWDMPCRSPWGDLYWLGMVMLQRSGARLEPGDWPPPPFTMNHMTGSTPICSLCSHSLVRRKNNSYVVGIKPQLKREIFEICVVQKNIRWYRMEVQYCKIRWWFTSDIACGFISKHIIWCTYDI